MNRACCLLILCLVCSSLYAGDKYALLAAVREYEHPEMNQPLLQYPEVDAKSMNDLLKESGYEVDLLLGKQANQTNIRKRLALFSEKGGNKGVVLVGLFGHGIEFESTKKSYFCPYDTSVKAKRDVQGRPISDDNGKPRMEPAAEKLISIDEILLALRESKATNRILLADCCRNDPNAARGRSFGTSLEINQLPTNTAVLFACSAQEKAFEHADWGHGAFTKCLLDSIRSNSGRGKTLMGSIAEDVGEAVESLVKSKVSATQTPFLLSTGTRIDLQLTSTSPPKVSPPSSTTTKPSPSGQPPKQETTSRGFEGTKAGESKDVNGMVFHWCPAGSFTMGSPKSEAARGSDEDQVSVTLSSGFWLGETELTQGQWQKLMGTTPWRGESFVKEGLDYPATYISYFEAISYCEKLTELERSRNRLPKGWKYSLPTEAQWEYACRAGTKTKYSFGENDGNLGDYGWFRDNAYSIKEEYAHRVGQKTANPWGFRDMHGNVWEWCSDWYESTLRGGRDSNGATSGLIRVLRGGGWNVEAPDCRLANRSGDSPYRRLYFYGFRLAAVPE